MATQANDVKNDNVVTFTPSCGNVFEDIGFPPEEAELLQAKAKLKIQIECEARRRRLSPKALAEILGIRQSQVSDLLTGKVSKMTLDKLFKYGHRLGMKVDIKAAQPRRKAAT